MANEFKVRSGLVIEGILSDSSLEDILVINSASGLLEYRRTLPTSSILNFDLNVSASAAQSGFGNFTLDGEGVYSSSTQISNLGVFLEFNGDNVISGSEQINEFGYYRSGSNVIFGNVVFDGGMSGSGLPSISSERTPLVIDSSGNIGYGDDYTVDDGSGSVDMTAPSNANAILLSVASGSKEIQEIDTAANFLNYNLINIGQIVSSNIVSSSTQISGYNTFLEIIGDNVISSSNQVSYTGLQNIPSNIVSSSTQISNYNTFLEIIGDNVISSSNQVNYNQLQNIPSNIVSSSTQISNYNTFLEFVGDNVISSSTQVNYNQLQNIPSNIVSGSGQLDILGLSSTDDVTFGTLNANTIVANEFVVSSSVLYFTQSFSSGSTKFGDTFDDTHEITGSLNITGSFNLQNANGNSIFSVGNDGIVNHNMTTLSLISADTDVISVSRTSYKSLHLTYHLSNNTGDAFRSGMVNYVWNSTNTTFEYTEFTTNDLGNSTNGIEFSGSFDGSNFISNVKVSSGTWNVKVYGNVL